MISKISTFFKEILGENNDLVESVEIAFKERATSPFYGYFILSWLITNWKIIYVAILVDQQLIFEQTKLLRSDYINAYIFPNTTLQLLFSFFITPFCITFVLFWIAPFITRIFYRKSIKNQLALKIIELEETKKEKKLQKELVKEEVELIEERAKKIKQEKKLVIDTPEVVWQEELTDFSGRYKNIEAIKSASNIIYGNNGYFTTSKTDAYGVLNGHYLDPEFFSILDISNLVEKQKGTQTIDFTLKGKFFLKELRKKGRI